MFTKLPTSIRHDRGWWTWLQWTQSTGATSLQKAMVCPWDSSATFTHTHPNRYTTNVNTSLGKAVGGGEIFLECRALKWQWFRFRHRKIFPDDEVIERERHWAGRKSENPIQKNASVLVPSLTYLKALPSLRRVHKPPSARSRLLQASRNLQPPPPPSRGAALWWAQWIPTTLQEPSQCHLFCGALHDPPHGAQHQE